MKYTSCKWPKLTHNTEQWAFTATIWSRYHQVHTWFNFKGHFFNKNISIRWNDWDFFKSKIFSNYNLSLCTHINKFHWICSFSSTLVCSFFNLCSSELSRIKIMKNLIKFMNKCSITSQCLNIFIRYDNSTDSFGKIN